jgi:hypothetical protein
MTRDETIRMAREAGIDDWWISGNEIREELDVYLEHFAALVAAAVMKREHQWMSAVLGRFSISEETVEFIRDVIRARGEK